MPEKEYKTVAEAAKLLKISRIAVFKKIKFGKLEARKIGRNYAIPKTALSKVLKAASSKSHKIRLKLTLRKVIKESQELLKLLSTI